MKFLQAVFLERSGFGVIPVPYRGVGNGVNGVVCNMDVGDLMVTSPNALATTFDPVINKIGSANFLADRNRMEQTSTGQGPFSTIVDNLNGIETGLWHGQSNPSQALDQGMIKLRMFAGVGGVKSGFTNPPCPPWLATLVGQFVVVDPFSSVYWVAGVTQVSGDQVVSPTNGLTYTANTPTTINNAGNTVDPGTASVAGWSAGSLIGGGGPCTRWFGPSAAKYLAFWTYLQLVFANCRVWVDNPNYKNPGDGGFWTAGPINSSTGVEFTLDLCPVIGEVTMSACTTIYGEPCIRQISGANSSITNANFLAAGYTAFSGLAPGHDHYIGAGSLGNGQRSPFNPAPDSDVGQILACQVATAAAWQHTSISEANNPFQIQKGSDVTAGVDPDPTITTDLILGLISACQPGQAVPGNNSINGNTGDDGGILALITQFGGPTYSQTDIASRILSAGKTMTDIANESIAAGLWNLELPPGNYTTGGSPTTPAGLQALLSAMQTAMANQTGAYAASNTRQLVIPPALTARFLEIQALRYREAA